MWKNFRQQVLCYKRQWQFGAETNRQGKCDYKQYEFTSKERMLCFIEGMTLVSFLGYFFYRSLWGVLFLIPMIVWYWKEKKRKKGKVRRQALKIEFKECILCVSASLRAGYSVENAFRESYREMQMLYGEKSFMAKELRYIKKGLDNNVNLEWLLQELGDRSGVEEIREFAEVFAIAKRNGGNMPDIIHATAALIHDKTEVDREIQVLISGKKMEQNIMSVVPFAIVTYVQLSSKGFFDVLYHNIGGIAVMTTCLIVYMIAYQMGSKITEVQE